MKLKQVNSSQLKWDPTGHPLWFNDLERDLYLIIGKNDLKHFELSIGTELLSGGASKALQYGKIKDGAGSRQDISRVVDYQMEIPEELKNQAVELVEACEGIEPILKTGLIQYIKGFSFGRNPLLFNEGLKSYLPIEKRKFIEKEVPLSMKVRNLKQKLPKHLGLKFIGVLIVASIFALYFSMNSSKANQFLEMDNRINITYIEKYVSEKGDLEVVDSLGRNILHRAAPFLNDIYSERYHAFEFLILNKNLNPNTFDLNGKTPLYYLINSYVNPELPQAKSKEEAEAILQERLKGKYKVIEKLLKLGLDSRLKKNPTDTTASDLAEGDFELKNLLSKYR